MKKPAFGDKSSLLLCTALLCIATAAGCSASKAPDHVLHGNQSEDSRSRVRAEKANIEALQQNLTAGEAQGSPAQPGGGTDGTTVGATDGGKAPVQNAGCQQTCDVSVALCESTETICEIAEENPTDDEFRDTCQWATDACSAAVTQCQACGG